MSSPDKQTGDSSASSSPTIPKAKVSAFTRFKTFTTSGFKSTPEPPFPPSTWELSDSPQSGSGASDWDQKSEKYRAGLDKWREKEAAKKEKEKSPAPEEQGAEADGNGDQDAPDSRTLAMRIKSLIDEQFTFGAGKSSSTSGPDDPPTESRIPPATPPATPPANASASSSSMFGGLDATLAKLLSTESIMNGEVGKGLEKGRESVWAMLDKLGAMAGAADPNANRAADKGKGKATDPPIDEGEGEGIMMYTPLQPTKDLEPEIAESELEYNLLHLPLPKPVDKPAPKPKRTFYPSSTQISLEVTWWGYRLFLPPPILAQLSSTHIAAAKRGAMITAALKWLIDQVPLMVIPLQMRAGVMMLKRMSPYLGYVGAFVAWSWTRVQAKDEGHGVVLTATWLLPIAILPATWDYDIHGRPRDVELIQATNNPGTDDASGEQSANEQTDKTPSASGSTSGARSQPTTPPSEEPGLLSSVSRRWNSLRSAPSKK
ncbi:hypothetical protein BDP27DRAFT_1320093 [Rhodocollybia butyracea]|uniref:Uncharacterized protein n=1 Tax=Rhodocollybia butyracea TaxID=206335 RepID=A0A9P5Q199_9AGAR|nr:hypothetical protein BDP27DRAFT_1320093 [Rhodocollybia butyracea]